MRWLAVILASLTLGVNAQTIHITTQNVLDLKPDGTNALSGLVGQQRIKATFSDGSDPLDVTAGLPIALTVRSRVDDYILPPILNSVTSAPPDTVWWVIPSLSAGEYELTASVVLPGDSFPVFWRYLSVTSAPSAALSLTNINNITVGDTSVTNIFGDTIITNNINVDVAGVVVTNNVLIDQATYITNFIDQFVGINVLSPILVDTNISGTWTILLTTNYPVGIYEQTGNITSIVFAVDSTNDVALGEVMLLATTNAITWPTNGLTWATGTAPTPTPTAAQYNRIYFEAWRGAVFGVYVGANP